MLSVQSNNSLPKPTYRDAVCGTKSSQIMQMFDNPQKLPEGLTPSFDDIAWMIDTFRAQAKST